MTSNRGAPNTRDPLSTILVILVALSLVAAIIFLALGFPPPDSDVEATVPSISQTPETGGTGQPGGETITENGDGGSVTIITSDDLRELALALAAIITALTGLFGIVATQVWRRREENRADNTHALSLERERLALERERLQLERDRLELERQREALLGKL